MDLVILTHEFTEPFHSCHVVGFVLDGRHAKESRSREHIYRRNIKRATSIRWRVGFGDAIAEVAL